MENYIIPTLPLQQDIETKAVMKKSTAAAQALAELKGVAVSMPNQSILISTLSLQEAKDSSEIENIVTTNDELYQSDARLHEFTTVAAKEVHMYACALRNGYARVKESGLLRGADICAVQAELEGNDAGFRAQAGTSLRNEQTGEIVYVPPQSQVKIHTHIANLEQFINEDALCEWDPLVKMAVIHHQFESIHPFYDGNGRTGRIVNILYLVLKERLNTPILYLSRYINQNKSEYYRLLQAVRDEGVWEEWVLFILEGIRVTSYQTIRLIEGMKRIMLHHKVAMKTELKGVYSQDLINLIFSQPYTKISHAEQALDVSRPTATSRLNKLVEIGLMEKVKFGREWYYINKDLMECLRNTHDL